jgi:hypothetical protein
MAYSMPPPTVQPTRVFEKLAEAPGMPVRNPVVSVRVLSKPAKATPPVA